MSQKTTNIKKGPSHCESKSLVFEQNRIQYPREKIFEFREKFRVISHEKKSSNFLAGKNHDEKQKDEGRSSGCSSRHYSGKI